MRKTDVRFVSALACGLATVTGCTSHGGPERPNIAWTLAWSDEFDGAAGDAVDSTKWAFDVGGSGWGNNQLEYDTDRTANASLDGAGNLAIVARREDYQGKAYTSARLNTRGKFERTYGRFDARIQLPRGRGIWPAFWLLGANVGTAGWPQCGEIDVMEYRGQEPWVVHGSLHGPGYSGSKAVTKPYVLAGTGDFFDDFHVFRVDWTPTMVSFYVDDEPYQDVALDELPGASVYDHAFFILLNLAVGGGYVGDPDASTPLPQTMRVDYVRVFGGTVAP